MTTDQRIAIERKIAKLTIRALLDAGYHITVNDGEEDALENSTLPSAILEAMFSTDEDYLFCTDPLGAKTGQWVRFVYGNDGYDVISDYTVSLETALRPVNAEINRMENQAS